MNHQEAKFLLRAYRADTNDAKDPVFADALNAANHEPALKAWLEREDSFDRTLRDKLSEIQPPTELLAAILAGSRASRPPRSWWKNPAVLAVAASIAIILTAITTFRPRPPAPSAHDFAEFALHELATTHNNSSSHRPDVQELQTQLTAAAVPLPGNPQINGDELRRAGCRVVKFSSHEVYEVCFQRNGRWFHLYATRLEDLARGSIDARALMMTKGRFTATAWKDDKYAYALVTDDTPEALRNLI